MDRRFDLGVQKASKLVKNRRRRVYASDWIWNSIDRKCSILESHYRVCQQHDAPSERLLEAILVFAQRKHAGGEYLRVNAVK
jgi:hypothetical protein